MPPNPRSFGFSSTLIRRDGPWRRSQPYKGWREQATMDEIVLEAWSQGLMVGALVVMACITIAAMRRQVLLHKLILLEQCLAIPHGTFCFMSFNGYGWYISATATLLYGSYCLHNVVAWMKVKPFFVGETPFFGPQICRQVKYAYVLTFALTIPVWIFEIYNNFRFNNNINDLFQSTRPYEPFYRDPWWVFTNIILLHVIRKSYGSTLLQLIASCPRLGILLGAIFFAIVFTIMDIVVSASSGKLKSVGGINPYWKLSLIFKCLTDAIMLDDFKTELGRLSAARQQRESAQRPLELRLNGSDSCPTLKLTNNGGIRNMSQGYATPSFEIGNVYQIEDIEKPNQARTARPPSGHHLSGADT